MEITKQRLSKDADYYPYQYICKKCGVRYGSDAKKDNHKCLMCIDYTRGNNIKNDEKDKQIEYFK